MAESKNIYAVRTQIAHHFNNFVVVSPIPSIKPDLVGISGLCCLEYASMSSDRSYRAPSRTCRYNRGAVSVL